MSCLRVTLIARSHGDAIGAEFALVLPVLLLFLLGIIDVGRYMWSINQLEKATQIGARMAVVTDMVASDLGSDNYGTVVGAGRQDSDNGLRLHALR